MLGAWPEPFGLVAIESMATGTPVIARRAGALPEIVQHGQSGFLVDDLQEATLAVGRAGLVDRSVVRQTAIERFSTDRMLDDYERVYRALVTPLDAGPDLQPDRPLAVAAGGGRTERRQDRRHRHQTTVAALDSAG
jgi:hypothetical protein